MSFARVSVARAGRHRVRLLAALCLAAALALFFVLDSSAVNIPPVVAIHDSELTRTLDSSNSPAVAPTPSDTNSTGLQWWIKDWHYFVMPESAKEAMRSDGTPFAIIGDSNIVAGALLTNGQPKYPILISLACEAIRDDEIAALTNYVAAGGFLLVGSSSFTRNTNGTTRGDFAFANALGLHMANPALTNWIANRYFTKTNEHRIITHVPGGQLTWRLPRASEEINWGISPAHPFLDIHDAWKVSAADATVLAIGDVSPYLTVKQFGKGWFIYYAAMQPLIGHSNFQPSMYSYVIFRKTIEWAFESMNLPLPKLSPWPYPYDAAYMVRHDLENFTNEMAAVAASAQVEFTNGCWGDYYLCTGTVRDDATNSATIIAGLRQAVTNYGATIAPHNGGLKNINNTNLVRGNYDYWHWGPDEALDVTNPPPTGYANGKAYAFASMGLSYQDVEGWLAGITNSVRSWSSCNFNGTREDSYDLESQLNVRISGDQKLTPFPHWTLSTKTSGFKYAFLSVPVSEWFVGGLSAQSMEPWHPPGVHTLTTLHDGMDFYYKLGAVVGFYSHTLSTGLGDAGALAPEYVSYGVNPFYHPRLWSTNATGLYYWWLQRSNAQVTVTQSTNGYQSTVTFTVTGSSNTNNAVELLVPGSGSAYGLQVFTNNVLDPGGSYRTNGAIVKVRVGTAITNAQVRYVLGPRAQNDSFAATNGVPLTISSPGVLSNDSLGLEPSISAVLVSGPSKGSINLNADGSFTYRPSSNFIGSDVFTYKASDGLTNASAATATILLSSPDTLYNDNFIRTTDPAPLSPWVAQANAWTITGGTLRGSPNTFNSYGFAYLTNYGTSNYVVQANVQFGANAYGGGIGARLEPTGGSHYAAWIYPENSPGGSKRLRLIKFQNYSTFSYNGGAYMADLPLAAVGTNSFHSLKLAMFGNQLAIYFDGTQVVSMADAEAQPYLSGGVSADLWTGSSYYNMLVDNVAIMPLAVSDGYFLNQNVTSVVPAPGVLGNDTPVFSTSLTASLVTGPTNGSLTLNADGSFSYTPNTNYIGPDFFTYQANDGVTNLGMASVSINVLPVNHAPVLPAQSNITVNATLSITVTNTATDTDLPPQTIVYSLSSVPAPSTNPPVISTNGIISWTPGQKQGGTYTLTTIATDNGSPPLTATNSFTVTVKTNSAPFFLAAPANRTVVPLTVLTITNTAADNDLPPNNLNYTLLNPPAGATITNGIISWTPSPAQDHTTNIITTVVTDDGIPPLSATNSFTIIVNDSPVVVLNSTALVLESCPPTNNAVDPGETVTMLFTLKNTGLGSTINLVATLLQTNGVVAPSGPQTYGVIAAGGGTVGQTFTFTASGGCGQTITPTLQLQDNTLSLGSLTASIGLGPSGILYTQTFDTVVAPAIPAGWSANSSTNVFWITATNLLNTGTNAALGPDLGFVSTVDLISPVFSLPSGQSQLSFRHRYGLECNVSPPTDGYDGGVVEIKIGTNAFADVITAGGTFITSNGYNTKINANYHNPLANRNAWSGTNNNYSNVVINLPLSAAGQNVQLRWRIGTDDGNGGSGWWVDNIGINGVLCCIHVPPVLTAQTNRTVNELTTLTVTNSATDSSSAPGALNYSLTVSPPATNSAIDSNGVITWTPSEGQGPGVYLLTTVVSDSAPSPLSATNSFQVTVNEINLPPQLPHPQPDRTITGTATLTVTNTATDPDIPVNPLTYTLTAAPANAAIDTNGIIAWTPAAAQVPGVYTFTTVVTDTNPAAVNAKQLSDTNSFMVTVQAIHNGPSLPMQTNQTVDEMTQLVVTNTAADADIPPRNVSYQLLPPSFGATIDTNGVIRWTPSETQGPGTYLLTTVATDDDPSPKSATNSFQVTVNEVNRPPQLPRPQPDRTIIGTAALVVTNTATDPDIPANPLTYVLTTAPTNAEIDTNGIITWTPLMAQVPGVYTFTTVVTDTNPAAVNATQLSDTNIFTVTVLAIHNGPSLPSQVDQFIAALSTLIVTNTATDSDLPPNNLTYVLTAAPTNAAIDANGIITWSPTPDQSYSTNVFATLVTDDGKPPLSASNSFFVVVSAMPATAPVIEAICMSNNVVTIKWSSVQGHTYRLQFNNPAGMSDWSNVAPDLLATGTSLTATNAGDAAQRIYRVQVVQ